MIANIRNTKYNFYTGGKGYYSFTRNRSTSLK